MNVCETAWSRDAKVATAVVSMPLRLLPLPLQCLMINNAGETYKQALSDSTDSLAIKHFWRFIKPQDYHSCLSWPCKRELPSVLWRCWLCIEKSTWPQWPVKKLSDEVAAWLSVWIGVQMICIWSSWCHCQPVISCFIKIPIGLTVLVPLTQVVLKKRPDIIIILTIEKENNG